MQSNKLTVDKITITENRIECSYTAEGIFKDYIKGDLFFVEYSMPVDAVPESVAVIPFLCQMLPIAWVFDAEIIVTAIDADFYEAIPRFKQGYIDMYPAINFCGKLTAQKIEKNKCKGEKTAAFFSGGLDSWQTLLAHIDESPVLSLIWGSDIDIANEEGWNVVFNYVKRYAEEFNLDYITIKSNFRKIANRSALTKYVKSFVNEEWWRGFHHGIGIIGHMAPYAYVHGVKTVCIAGTISKDYPRTCASHPDIDSFVRFCGSSIVHEGYDYNRIQKIEQVVAYSEANKKAIELRVCWKSENGANCCECEKCIRTIIGIVSAGHNPRNFGFAYSDKQFSAICKKTKQLINFDLLPSHRVADYKTSQALLQENYTIKNVPKELKWLYDCTFKPKKGWLFAYKCYLFAKTNARKTKNRLVKIVKKK